MPRASGAEEKDQTPESLPTGTVTFLFTDIEGSTQRWETNRAAMDAAVKRHDALLRSTMEAHGGYVFKTVGDAFCVAFARVSDAVAACVDAQRALSAEDFTSVDRLLVRMGIHVGEASERDGDYFGPTVNRIARLLAIGHGGQVLLSRVAAELVQGALAPHVSLRDLGQHQLKDLARPEHVSQLLAPGLAADFPALRSLGALPNNLPLQLTPLIGREKEIEEITALIDQHRLVTLVGSGGVGKTRTSLQVAANLIDGSGDGVWLIELAPLSSGDYIPSTVAQALDLTLAPEGDPVENLARALKTKHALLVFDNCEHLVHAAAHVIATVLRLCPDVKVLASSREGLEIAGEQTYRLPSLEFPAEGGSDHLLASEAERCAAVALFTVRARAVDKRFTLTDENAATVAEICRRLDGIPLAIELAAARVRILSPRQLRERLDERFRVLTGGSRTALPRQQTLRALIDWSHDLLDERERSLFRRLGTFVNGFALEGALAVGGAEGLDAADVFDVLSSLVNKSLVLAEPVGNSLRYRMLESTRAYALEKLAAAAERDVLADRHLRYLSAFFAAAYERHERTARWAELDDALGSELEDTRAALEWALRGPDVRLGAGILADIGTAWESLALEREAMARVESFLTVLPATEARLRARLSMAMVVLASHAGSSGRAFEAARQAVENARLCDHAPTLADALLHYATNVARLGKADEAAAALREAETIEGVSAALRLRRLASRAFVSGELGNHEIAVGASESLREAHRALGNASMERVATLNLAELEHARGHTQRAIALIREVLPGFRAHGDRLLLVNVLSNLAGYLAAVDDFDGARAAAREAILVLAPRDPEGIYVVIPIENLALGHALSGDPSRAAMLSGYVEPSLRKLGFEREFNEASLHDRLTTVLRERLQSDELERLMAAGAVLSPEEAIAVALEESA